MDYTTIIVVAALLIFVVGRRMVGGVKGTKYSTWSIFLRPVIYLVLSAVLMIALQLWQIGVLIIAIALGILLGRQLGKKSDIFEKDGVVMYKRSMVVLAIWIIAFILRIAISFYSVYTNPALVTAITNSSSSNLLNTIDLVTSIDQSNPLVFGSDLLLAGSAGLLFGEAMVLLNDFNKNHRKAKPAQAPN